MTTEIETPTSDPAQPAADTEEGRETAAAEPTTEAGTPGEAEAQAGASEEASAGEQAGASEEASAEVGPKDDSKKWYIVHTYSGHEAKAKQALLDRAKALGHADDFDEVLIPEETVVEIAKGGEKKTSKRKFFPGYILVRMNLDDETWHIVRDTPKITGFVGGGTNPPTISDEEVARMTQQIREGAAKPKPRIRFEEGENIRVTSGPFANFQGIVDEVRPDKEKVRVMVQVFGRATPVEVDYTQLEKA